MWRTIKKNSFDLGPDFYKFKGAVDYPGDLIRPLHTGMSDHLTFSEHRFIINQKGQRV